MGLLGDAAITMWADFAPEIQTATGAELKDLRKVFEEEFFTATIAEGTTIADASVTVTYRSNGRERTVRETADDRIAPFVVIPNALLGRVSQR